MKKLLSVIIMSIFVMSFCAAVPSYSADKLNGTSNYSRDNDKLTKSHIKCLRGYELKNGKCVKKCEKGEVSVDGKCKPRIKNGDF